MLLTSLNQLSNNTITIHVYWNSHSILSCCDITVIPMLYLPNRLLPLNALNSFLLDQLRINKIKDFIFYYVFSNTLSLCRTQFLIKAETWITFFNISFRAGLLVINSLCFCFPWKFFISVSVLKGSFAGFGILGWW